MTKNQVYDASRLDQLESMWQAPGVKPTLIAVLAAFGGWSILLPVIPQAIMDGGGSTSLAGAYTGVFMAATVLTQTQTPMLLRRIGYGPTMFISGLFLALPTLIHLFGTEAWVVLPSAILRGMGFGALTVAESALIAVLVPMKFLGKATGMLGLVVGLSQLVFLPLGLFIVAQTDNYHVVYWLGTAISVVGSVMALLIPRIKAPAKAKAKKAKARKQAKFAGAEPALTPAEIRPESPVAAVATWKLIAVPAISISTIAMGFGGVSTFLAPAARDTDPVSGAIVGGIALSALGGAQMVSRYCAGVYSDRKGVAGTLIVPALFSGALGLALVALVTVMGWSSWLILAAAVLFGMGFGVVQNEALLQMFARLPRERNAEASAYWNMAFDSGTGSGSFVLGAAAGLVAQQYPMVFGLGAVLVIFGFSVALLDQIVGRHRVSEYQNTRATLRRITFVATSSRPVATAAKVVKRILPGRAEKNQSGRPRRDQDSVG